MVLGISCSNAPRLEENGESVQAVPFGVLRLASEDISEYR